jgi:hypothetical protein
MSPQLAPPSAPMTWPDPPGHYWRYLYLLRVPLLIWIVLVALPPLSVWGAAPMSPLLRGLFDLAPPLGGVTEPWWPTFPRVALAFGLVTLQALMVATAVAVTARLILLKGAARFDAGVVPNAPGVKLAFRLIPALGAIVIVAGSWSQSFHGLGPPRATAMVAGTVAGAAGLWFLAGPVQDFLWARLQNRRSLQRTDRLSRAIRWLIGRVESVARHSPTGYLDSKGQLDDKHVFALFQALISLAVYVALLLAKAVPIGTTPWVPTLCLTLTLLLVLCWAFASATFFFDRFRIPLLLVVAVYMTAVGLSARSDSFYHTTPRSDPSWNEVNYPLAQLLRSRGEAPARAGSSLAPVVVVAATGGGIQASAWTARVMGGLHRDTESAARRFDEAVRVISSVSGGSVGALFVLDAYDRGRLPAFGPGGLDDYPPVASAEASSLDEVAWGLVYSDLLYSAFPMLRFSVGMLTSDRGSALESAWRARVGKQPLPLGRWRKDALSGERPAVIFNATLAESGERLLLSTTDLERPSEDADAHCETGAQEAVSAGRRDFRTLYCDREIDAVTAARLSATFPYVSPATRILRDKGPREPEYHVVDGGYYDNYGIATLVEWLEDAIRRAPAGSSLPPVLIVEIRAKPVGGVARPDGARGATFQLLQPLTTMLAVWGIGQISHNELDMRLLGATSRIATLGLPVRRVVFEFPATDEDGVQIRAPLSWHLTPDDRRILRWAWNERMKECRDFVISSLIGFTSSHVVVPKRCPG